MRIPVREAGFSPAYVRSMMLSLMVMFREGKDVGTV